MDTKPVLNRERLDSLRAIQRPDKPSLIERIVRIYQSESAELLQTLERAVDQRQAEGVRQAAHRFKSIGGNVGADRLFAMCHELEQIGRDGVWDGVPARLEELTAEHRKVGEALARVLEEG